LESETVVVIDGAPDDRIQIYAVVAAAMFGSRLRLAHLAIRRPGELAIERHFASSDRRAPASCDRPIIRCKRV
jgi:hypothetical protein